MADKTLSDLAQEMRRIDVAILSSVSPKGEVTGRPMSNNKDVEFDGDSYYFADDSTDVVKDLEANPQVGLGFQGDDNLYISVKGVADLVRDKGAFEAHWNPDLDEWFEDGIDTEGLVMIHVKAKGLQYWNGREGGEISL